MTIIRTTCPMCGTVSLTDEQMRLLEVPSSIPFEDVQTYCVFECPRCGEHVRRAIDELTVESLHRAGVRFERGAGRGTRGRGHPEHPPDGPPFTPDDLLDLHLLLQEEDWFELCASSVR